MNRLKEKVAVIYGHGSVRSAVAKAFAAKGAAVYLTGRDKEKLEGIAQQTANNVRGCWSATVHGTTAGLHDEFMVDFLINF